MTLRKWKILHKFTVQKVVDILLKNRGVKTKKEKEELLNPKIEKVNLENVGIDKNTVRKAIKRINEAIRKNEKIVIYGDYDVDGICGTAILWESLFAIYKNVIPYIPHRVDEGYGLSVRGIENILKANSDTRLIVTVDNGIVAHEAVKFANKNGIDVIITDHHVKAKKDPEAYSIVHTTQLCGAGVAYLLAQELLSVFSSQLSESGSSVVSSSASKLNYRKPVDWKPKTENREPITDSHLELVALATIADLVPLVGSNRALVKFGIEALKKTKRAGLLALFAEAQIEQKDIDVYKIGHIIAPRINAAGRIAHAMDSLRLLCTKDVIRAKNLAEHLGQTNRQRQLMTEEATARADLITEVNERIIFAHDEKYNQGIIGLVASRLVDKHYKPSIVVSVGETISKGSARSVPGFNIIEYLRTFSVHLIDAGGHPMAAGFTIETARIGEFKDALFERANRVLGEELLERILRIDMELGFKNISSELYSTISELSPFGMGNPEPVFVSRNVKIENARAVGQDNQHLKLELSQDGIFFDGIFFGGGEAGLKIGRTINVVYQINEDEWNGNTRLQLKIKDLKTL